MSVETVAESSKGKYEALYSNGVLKKVKHVELMDGAAYRIVHEKGVTCISVDSTIHIRETK